MKDTYVSLLKNGTVTVKFTKADGSERTMKCTLNPKLMPEDDQAGAVAVSSKPSNDNVVPCWDLDKAGWRSFRLDTVIEMTFASQPTELSANV
jgi:hypothetical protein